MPFQAKTNRNTQLIRLGGANIDLAEGTTITVHNEHGSFATASVVLNGSEEFGSIVTSHYVRI